MAKAKTKSKKTDPSTLEIAMGNVVETLQVTPLLSVDVYEDKGILDSRVIKLTNIRTKDEIHLKASTVAKLFMDLSNKNYLNWSHIEIKVLDENS